MMSSCIRQRWNQSVSWVQGRQGQGQGPRVGPKAWGLGDAIDSGRHRARAMAGTRGLCSRVEPGWRSEAKGGNGCSAKGSKAKVV